MGGFSLTNYIEAKQNRDAQGLATINEFADYSMRIVLGVEGAKVSLAGSQLTVAAPPAVSAKIIGAWTFASSAQQGGVVRLRYIFNADGTYSFKVRTQHAIAEVVDYRRERIVFS
jgi:hypothetical protein